MTHKTVNRLFKSEIEVKRSRFIAHLLPSNDFDLTLKMLRDTHRKASHHVTAIRVIDQYDRIAESCRDDGEPAGTSDMPVLKSMIGADLVDAGLIVTRYFGGTKLGTGGLSRAYSSAAKAVIQSAVILPWFRMKQRELTVPFEQTAIIEQKIADAGLRVVSRDYSAGGTNITIEGSEAVLNRLLPE